LILLFHKGNAISASDGVRRFWNHSEESLQIVSIAKPGIVCLAHPNHVKEVVDYEGIGTDISHSTFLARYSELHNQSGACVGVHR